MSRHHLTISEREIISQLVAQGPSRKIADQLGRSLLTISRELSGSENLLVELVSLSVRFPSMCL
jgi:IS30 family transposase